jgi:cytochrome c oxidase subunit 1
MTWSAFVLGLAQIPFAINFLGSLAWGKRAESNPWKANTLEWQIPSPPIPENFEEIPVVYHGPYEYSSPLTDEDYLPQDKDLGTSTHPSPTHEPAPTH